MKRNYVINFDMDGTLADLYNTPDWLTRIRNYDVSPYLEAKPLVPLNQIARQLNRLQEHGYRLRILSWSSKESTPEFDAAVKEAKVQWLSVHMPSVHWDEIVVSEYGVNKSTLGRGRGGILFDDNAEVRSSWKGTAFSEKHILEILKNLGR